MPNGGEQHEAENLRRQLLAAQARFRQLELRANRPEDPRPQPAESSRIIFLDPAPMSVPEDQAQRLPAQQQVQPI